MAAAGALATEMNNADARVRRPVRRARGAWGAVAAALIMGVGALVWRAQPERIATHSGQRQSLTLTDGSRADLNAQTRLTVAMERDRRLIRLEQGEAMFRVTHDAARPFFVETAVGTVRVTGTVFNVRMRPAGVLEVTVLEGHVSVQPQAKEGSAPVEPRALVAGDQLEFDAVNAALHVSRPASVEDTVAWRDGKVVFAGTPLGEALERFASYHGAAITVAPEAAALPLGGRYTLDDFDRFMASVEQALPVRVLRRGDGSLRIVAAPRAP